MLTIIRSVCNSWWSIFQDDVQGLSFLQGFEIADGIMIQMRKWNTNFYISIAKLCIKLISKSRVIFPRCRLIPLLIVMPILKVDVQIMQKQYLQCFREGDIVLYVSPFAKDERSMDINGQETWRTQHQQSCNEMFEEMLKSDKDHERFIGKMLYIELTNFIVHMTLLCHSNYTKHDIQCHQFDCLTQY